MPIFMEVEQTNVVSLSACGVPVEEVFDVTYTELFDKELSPEDDVNLIHGHILTSYVSHEIPLDAYAREFKPFDGVVTYQINGEVHKVAIESINIYTSDVYVSKEHGLVRKYAFAARTAQPA